MDLFWMIYFIIALVFFLVLLVVNFKFLVKDTLRHRDVAVMEYGMTGWETSIYVFFASLGSIAALGIIYIVKSLAWWYLVGAILLSFVHRKAHSKTQA